MNHIPSYQPKSYNLLAIDPGTNQMGVSIFAMDMVAFKIQKIRSWTIGVKELKNETGLVEEFHSASFLKLMKIKKVIGDLLVEENIHHVAYEAPFMGMLQPSAYGPLVALMTIVHMSVVEFGQDVRFTIFPPQTVKKSIGVAGKKGKEVVLEAIKNIPAIMIALQEGHCQLDDLDNNAVDSVAVGYTAVESELFRELKLCPIQDVPF